MSFFRQCWRPLAYGMMSLACLSTYPTFAMEMPMSETTETTVTPSRYLWSVQNQAAIDALLAQDLHGQVAVFDADETLWSHDVGEAFLQWLIAEGHLVQTPPAEGVWQHYLDLCAQDKMVGYPYAAQAMAGLSVTELQQLARTFFVQFQHNIYPAQQRLIQALQGAGAEVWIVSASNQWIIEAAAPVMGVPVERVVGIRVAVEDGKLTDRVVAPVTYRQGKVEAIQKYIQQQPVLVAGDSMTDYEMLNYAKTLALVINPKDKGAPDHNIARLAQQHGWAIQRWEKP